MKNLIVIERDKITLRKLKKGKRPMVGASGRLYRVDDALMLRDNKTGDGSVIYRIDSTQPIGGISEYVNPDMTKIFIDSAKVTGHPKASIWTNLDVWGGKIMNYLGIIIVGGIIIYCLLTQGGLPI